MKSTTKQILTGIAWFAILLAVIGGTILWQHQVLKPRHSMSSSITVSSTERVPSLLILDSHLSQDQQRQLIATMQRNIGTQSTLIIEALSSGTIRFSGQLRDADTRPYLKLQLPAQASTAEKVRLIKQTLTVAKKQLHFTHYNLIGYGEGGLLATHFLESAPTSLAPRNFVAIATAFNGTSTTNNSQKKTAVTRHQRNAELSELIKNRRAINAKVRVLVIAGKHRGSTNGDGVVPLQSALAAQSIFKPTVTTYQQHVIQGYKINHTGILESWKLGNFIHGFIN
ncbi:alpha/beta hydrolase [Lactiplantibacillus plajomi]|uniref:Alpha/beta hydrolase n=1 Tax=Lactiplantibacillus plajomi TaxID=1457217 RepID=A0ABV6K4X9_9LACO|nr:alpha/beta hydrolase [Lactiplantibacillus plajomi]